MATRKLKFKPKPTVTGAVRRVRDKDDSPDLTKEEQSAGSTTGVGNHSDSDPRVLLASEGYSVPMCESEQSAVANKRDTIESDTVTLNKLKITHDSSKSESSDGLVGSNNFVNIQNSDRAIANYYNTPSCLDPDKFRHGSLTNTSNNKNNVDHEVLITPSSDVDDNFCKSPLVVDTEKALPIEVEGTTKECTADKHPNTQDLDKGFSRFRTRCKPVLNSGLRKKNIAFEESSLVGISSPPLVRTDSVIKSVKAELNKAVSVANEIVESFSLLESNEPEPTFVNHGSGKQQIVVLKGNLRSKLEVPSCEPETKLSHSVSNVTSETEVRNGSNINTAFKKRFEEIVDVNEKINNLNEHSLEVSNTNTASSRVPVSPLRPTAKILVPKPSPRLSDVASRRVSFQESDSEDEGKRKKPSIKCDVFIKTNGSSKENKEKTLQNNKRSRSQGSTYSKMGQDTLEKFSKKFGKGEAPDKTKLTMLDLIFYNPKNNPMTANSQLTSTVRKKKEKSEVNEAVEEVLEEQSVDDVEPAALPVPQLKVGPDGQIMLDPQSLVIETTGMEKNRAKLEKSQVIQESGITRYSTYSKRRHERRDWSARETLQFYRALNTIGSDFTLMASLFPTRSRHALKLKFKREERTNLHLIDKAMTSPADFDFKALEEELRIENEEIERKELKKMQGKELAKNERAAKRKERSTKNPLTTTNSSLKLKNSAFKDFDEAEVKSIKRSYPIKCKPKKRKTHIMKSEDTDSDLEEELQMNLDSDPEVDDEDLSVIKIVKETCSGRVPKRTTKFEEYEEINETLKKKLEESESEEDGYIPNGLDAQMLFGSPLEAPSQETNGEQWDIVIPSVPNIEETVLLDDVEEVSELSELGSFGQNDMALDLSMPVRSHMPEAPGNLLNRHIISHSMQIIDQLTADVGGSSRCREVVVALDDSQDGMCNKVPLPSFESVSRSRPSVLFPQQPTFVTVNCETEPHENPDRTTVTIDSFYNVTDEECILGE